MAGKKNLPPKREIEIKLKIPLINALCHSLDFHHQDKVIIFINAIPELIRSPALRAATTDDLSASLLYYSVRAKAGH